jgi:hypothetical protein
LFASAFTGQGLGAGLRAGWDALAIACLCVGVVLCLLSVLWNRLSGSLINSRLANSAIELGSDARWWGASLMLLFMYAIFSPLLMNLANIDDIGVHIYPTWPSKTNRITWNFEDQQHPPFFLAFEKTNTMDAPALFGFQAHGKNNSDKPILNISGVVRSLITNKEFPIKIVAEGFYVDPKDTNGIPPFSEFDVTTMDGPVNVVNGQIVSRSVKMNDFAEFEFEFDYDGNKFVRKFTKDEIDGQRQMFSNILDPNKSSVPRVTRKVAQNSVLSTMQLLGRRRKAYQSLVNSVDY